MPKSNIKPPPAPTSAIHPPVAEAPMPAEGEAVHKIHYGNVRGFIRRKEGKQGIVHTVRCERVSLDSARQEQVSQVFQTGDLRMLAKVASECLRWIEWQERMHAEGRPSVA